LRSPHQYQVTTGYGETSSRMGIVLSQDQFAVRWLMEKEGRGDRMDWLSRQSPGVTLAFAIHSITAKQPLQIQQC
jgi:hypothetical protein